MEKTEFKELKNLMSMRFSNLLVKKDSDKVDLRINELCSSFKYEDEEELDERR